MTHAGSPWRVAVVGGGIAGLAAAYFLRDAASVTVFEGSPRLGGKLAVSEVAGIAADEGAEALLARRPEGTDLIRAVGLADQLVMPGTTSARIWTRGALRELPERQLMGVPSDFGALARADVLSAAGLARARLDAELPATPIDGDLPVAAAVSARFGQEVVDRLVDPLLGGVYAGRSEELSFDATLPGLAAAARRHRSLAEAAGTLLPPLRRRRVQARSSSRWPAGSPRCPRPWPRRPGRALRTGSMVRELARIPNGWRLVTGPASQPETVAADAVILAVPARRGQQAAGPGGGQRGGGAGRDPLREHGDRHAGLPAGGVLRPAGRQRLPGARRGRARGQGGHVQHRQVAAPAVRSRTTTACTSSGARSAGSARRRSCSGTTPSWPRWRRGSSPPPPGSAARPPRSG